MRLGIEREHEAQAFGQGLTFLHIENMPLMQGSWRNQLSGMPASPHSRA
jgi:hypothetical protein